MTKDRETNGTFSRVPVADRFWSKVDTTGGPDACWIWQGPKRDTGYGYTTDFWKKILAHRMAYELTYGPVPPGKNVCHSCDVRDCVNPAHLWAGSQSENLRDAAAKGRLGKGPRNPKRGEASSQTTLTEADVRAMRAAYQPGTSRGQRVTIRSLARKYGVTSSCVHRIIRREAWSHID